MYSGLGGAHDTPPCPQRGQSPSLLGRTLLTLSPTTATGPTTDEDSEDEKIGGGHEGTAGPSEPPTQPKPAHTAEAKKGCGGQAEEAVPAPQHKDAKKAPAAAKKSVRSKRNAATSE